MRTFREIVFDDVIVGTATVHTAERFNDSMGLPDQLAIQVVVDQVNASGHDLTLAIENSSDQRNWVPKSATPEIANESLSNTQTNVEVASDDGSTPSLAYVRLAITLAGTNPTAHVKIHVCGRDRG